MGRTTRVQNHVKCLFVYDGAPDEINMTRTVGQLLRETSAQHGAVPALLDPRPDPPVRRTYSEVEAEVRLLAAGLLGLGVCAGERVGFICDNGPRWLLSDLAMLSIGAVNVPRGADTPTEEILFILGHCGAAALIVQDGKTLDRLSSGLSRLRWLRLIIVLDDSSETNAGEVTRLPVMSYASVLEVGRKQPDARIEAQFARVLPTDIATIVYTSGTTGAPKGVMLTHANIVSQADNIDLGFEILPGYLVLSFLPAWHAYERVVEYLMLRRAATITYSDKRRLRSDLASVRPELLPCVPRMWESMYNAIHDRLKKRSPFARKAIALCLSVSHAFVMARRLATGSGPYRRPPGLGKRVAAAARVFLLWPVHALADALVYRQIRNVAGGRLIVAVSGGGSLPGYLDDFFESIGMPILNGYGLTETSPVLSVRRLNNNVRGTVGLPIKGTELRIRNEAGLDLPRGETGVIWARGPQVMRGYYRNGEETRKVMTAAGWLNTGDLGWITSTGHLVITGRAKDVIVLSSGENIEPERIETIAQQSPLVSQIMVVGQDRNTPGALVVPDVRQLAVALDMAPDTPPEAVLDHPAAVRTVRDSIAAVMAADGRFASYEQLSRIALLDREFSEENGMLTQTLKMRRNVIVRVHADTIEQLYARRSTVSGKNSA